MSRFYELRHVVGFEETNLVGNVYYLNYLRWQGRCRELFLHEHCPHLLDQIRGGLALVTTRCSCEFFAELTAFDRLVVRMRLAELSQSRVTMAFDYFRETEDGAEELVARGEQQVAFMRREGSRLVAAAVDPVLRQALKPYAEAT